VVPCFNMFLAAKYSSTSVLCNRFGEGQQQSCSRWSVLNKIRKSFSLKCEKQMGRAVGETTRSYFLHISANYTDDRSRGRERPKIIAQHTTLLASLISTELANRQPIITLLRLPPTTSSQFITGRVVRKMVRDRVTVRGGVGTYPNPLEAEGLLSLETGAFWVQEMGDGRTSLAGMRQVRAQLVPSSWYWERTLISLVCAWTTLRRLSRWAYIQYLE
jgi:hypothetical protein